MCIRTNMNIYIYIYMCTCMRMYVCIHMYLLWASHKEKPRKFLETVELQICLKEYTSLAMYAGEWAPLSKYTNIIYHLYIYICLYVICKPNSGLGHSLQARDRNPGTRGQFVDFWPPFCAQRSPGPGGQFLILATFLWTKASRGVICEVGRNKQVGRQQVPRDSGVPDHLPQGIQLVSSVRGGMGTPV